MLANLLQDIRYSLHGFALRPMFAAVVVSTLAVGIGVNVAAGVRRMVMRQVAWMAGLGVPVGIVAALLIGNLAASFLFDMAPTDPRAIVAAALVLAAAVLGASYWPARRASRVDPVVALRAE
jgi:ABC-type lipoprotein release transport system permease subunit